jgi:hypothetical protein
LAVNFNSNIPANQTVATVFNPKDRIKDVTADKKLAEDQKLQPKKLPEGEVKAADEATLARLDAERQAAADDNSSNGNSNSNSNNDKGHDGLEKPDPYTKKALTAYRDVGLAEKRSEIQSLVGVDVYI